MADEPPHLPRALGTGGPSAGVLGAAGIAVPMTALTRDREGHQGVLIVVDSRAAFRPVQTGASDGRQALITQGLATGERVVTAADDVKAGMRVRPQVAAGQ